MGGEGKLTLRDMRHSCNISMWHGYVVWLFGMAMWDGCVGCWLGFGLLGFGWSAHHGLLLFRQSITSREPFVKCHISSVVETAGRALPLPRACAPPLDRSLPLVSSLTQDLTKFSATEMELNTRSVLMRDAARRQPSLSSSDVGGVCWWGCISRGGGTNPDGLHTQHTRAAVGEGWTWRAGLVWFGLVWLGWVEPDQVSWIMVD